MDEIGTPQAEMAALLERFTGQDGAHATAIDRLRLFRASAPSAPIPGVYEPALCLIAQGRKRVLLGEDTYPYDPAHFLLVTVDLPVVGQVFAATPQVPYLGLRLALDIGQIGALLAELDLPETSERVEVSARGLSVGCLDDGLLDATVRLLRLLETPQHIAVLAPMVLREIWYRLLVGDQGARLWRIARTGDDTQDIGGAIHWLRQHFTEPLRIDTLAARVHMSPSAFHRHFKAVTARTPLQYQKLLRLQEARRLMLMDAVDAATAGYQVGYESASQFSREYRRLFGESPRRHILRLRGTCPVE